MSGPRFFATPADFRAWLEKNHAKERELLVGFDERAEHHVARVGRRGALLRLDRRRWFEAQAPSHQRAALHWVTSAKREETREKRLAELIADSAAARRIKPMIVRKSR